MKVLILAGGKGTRLQALVSDRPKPMALVGGRPFLVFFAGTPFCSKRDEAIALRQANHFETTNAFNIIKKEVF